jgi:dGTPase
MQKAPYASDPRRSRGRLHPEPESAFRSAFQRDRDRIIHSSAFRRLKHKTQVFVEHEGDYYRTRLTHSIEVAQVARTLAGVLGLQAELAEAVALAHDLGHTPFGHTGEVALARLMAPFGGFDHNAQALRIVTRLERHYAEFDGLNLTWETLEGIAKHNGPLSDAAGRPLDGPLPWALVEYNAVHDLELAHLCRPRGAGRGDRRRCRLQPPRPARRAARGAVHRRRSGRAAGDRPGLCRGRSALSGAGADAPAPRGAAPGVRGHGRGCDRRGPRPAGAARPDSAQAVRELGAPVIDMSPPAEGELREVRDFLFHRMYRAPSVMAQRARVTRVVEELFALFLDDPGHLPANGARMSRRRATRSRWPASWPITWPA